MPKIQSDRSFIKILTDIPFQIDRSGLQRNLRLKAGTHHLAELDRLIDQAEQIGKPKAIVRMIYIDEKGKNWIQLDGHRLTSRVLRINLEGAQRAFLFIATAGLELDVWSKTLTDLLHRFWADAIQEAALETARRALHQYLAQRYHPGILSEMHPGSLDDWPLSAQDDLFALLGDVKGAIGVSMTESKLMHPIKSVSGIAFSTQTPFTSCQLCPRENCRSRKAPFDPDLFEGSITSLV